MHKKCFHCYEANCLNVCPEKAIMKKDDWTVIDQDKCIECGFCEPICPSKNLSFTPRQRIAGRREISRRMVGGRGEAPLKRLVRSYRYQGMDTCAADGLCSTLCPVGIDTGKMIKALREEAHGQLANRVADWTADHFKPVAATAAVAAADPLFVNMGFTHFGAYPERGASRPLDAKSEGLISGEGAGVLALKRYQE